MAWGISASEYDCEPAGTDETKTRHPVVVRPTQLIRCYPSRLLRSRLERGPGIVLKRLCLVTPRK